MTQANALVDGSGRIVGYSETTSRKVSKAETGELRDVNVAIAVGQALGIESNAQATMARLYILRALHGRNAIPATASRALFEKAATFPLNHQPQANPN